MKSPNTTTSRSLPALGNPILAGREMLKGIALCPVKPQPFCRLVYSCMGDNCGKWVYPASNTWQEWNDEDYKRPDDISPDELKNVWISPYCIGDTVPVREPWAFMKCCDCYACETPQTRYRGNLGCFVFPTPQNQAYTQFKPARSMPKEAARSFIMVTRMQMMRLHKVPATQFHRDGLVCPDGHPFPNELCSTWNNFLDPSEITLYGWEKDPLVWVVSFERLSYRK